ncbi:MAG: aminopeptidase P family protein [Oscillospiraceae bacterium]|nr:aminopeptidase P family protein [Oscillospiraceae bacterium]
MRRSKLRHDMRQLNLDAMYLSSPENVRYFSGFTGDNGHLILTQEEQILLTDGRYTEQAAMEAKDVTVVLLSGKLSAAISKYVVSRRVGYESSALSDDTARALRAACPDTEWVPLSHFGLAARSVKDADEIAHIRRACAIADAAFAELLPLIRPGVTERELKRELEYRMDRLGSEHTAFSTIVACGERSSLPHATPTDHAVSEHDLITFDFGAVSCGYASDITRTVMLGTPELSHVFELVLSVQKQVVERVCPGISCSELDAFQRSLFAEAGMSEYVVHSLGHGVGLQIHEDPRVSPGSETVLTPGMVITIEPGLYLPGKGGVRTEDTVLVTEHGFERLTNTPHHIVL